MADTDSPRWTIDYYRRHELREAESLRGTRQEAVAMAARGLAIDVMSDMADGLTRAVVQEEGGTRPALVVRVQVSSE